MKISEKVNSILKSKTLVVIIIFLLGNGIVWQYLDYRLHSKTLELENAKSVSQLVINQNNIYDSIIVLSDRFIKLQNQYGQTENPALLNEMGAADTKLDKFKLAHDIIEAQLSKMINRSPRKLKIDFIPPAAVKDFSIQFK